MVLLLLVMLCVASCSNDEPNLLERVPLPTVAN